MSARRICKDGWGLVYDAVCAWVRGGDVRFSARECGTCTEFLAMNSSA